MEHIVPPPTRYLLTQVGYNNVLVIYKMNECCQSMNVHVNNNAQEFNLILLLCRLKINLMTDANCAFILELGAVPNK